MELEREEILLLPERLEVGSEGREERPEEEDTGKVVALVVILPVPQGILSPFG